MAESEKRLYVNGLIKKEQATYGQKVCFIPYLKIVRVYPSDSVKDSFNMLKYICNLEKNIDEVVKDKHNSATNFNEFR